MYDDDRKTVLHYLDFKDEEKSNWMCFVRCARFEEEQNLIAEQYDQKIFYRVYKRILPGQVSVYKAKYKSEFIFIFYDQLK